MREKNIFLYKKRNEVFKVSLFLFFIYIYIYIYMKNIIKINFNIKKNKLIMNKKNK